MLQRWLLSSAAEALYKLYSCTVVQLPSGEGIPQLKDSFLEAWSALVEAVRNGVVKHVSKLCHLYPSISFKVMVIGVLLAYLGTADNCRQPTYILYGKVY